jgi:hypothetical protein
MTSTLIMDFNLSTTLCNRKKMKTSLTAHASKREHPRSSFISMADKILKIMRTQLLNLQCQIWMIQRHLSRITGLFTLGVIIARKSLSEMSAIKAKNLIREEFKEGSMVKQDT